MRSPVARNACGVAAAESESADWVNNDPLRRAGSFHPTALTEACRVLRNSKRAGWVMAAAWHHNLAGGPMLDDYLDAQFIQLLIDAGVSLGFHGHQHSSGKWRINGNPVEYNYYCRIQVGG
jgi:hypothetical protein